MGGELVLRVIDGLLALFWIWALARTLGRGNAFGDVGTPLLKMRRPLFFWFLIFVMSLMVVHFVGLTWVGQKLG